MPKNSPKDDFDLLVDLNKAQLVTLHEEELLPSDAVRRMALAIDRVARDAAHADAGRMEDYLQFERAMEKQIGAEAGNLHLGRSRNDIGATRERLWLRQELQAILPELLRLRGLTLDLAERHVHTLIPSYTHAVQAQPVTLAHYLLAWDAALGRDAERLLACYGRLNRSPLGAGALATSGFLLNRDRLGELLGFIGLCDNSYDCIGVASLDVKTEFGAVLSFCALQIGRFTQDLLIQHADAHAYVALADHLVAGSSIMPQKRNPGPLEKVRTLAGCIVADAHAISLIGHNTPFGDVEDVRSGALRRALLVAAEAKEMLGVMCRIVKGIEFEPERARAKIDADYSTMTELADTLFREYGVPFRVGHGVARRLAEYGRARGKLPASLTVEEAEQAYREETGRALQIDAEHLRRAVDPAAFVASRRGRGGPQPEETVRMLEASRRSADETARWLEAEVRRLYEAERALETCFDACRRA